MTKSLLLNLRGTRLAGLCLAAGLLLSAGRAGAQTIKTLPGDYATFTLAINDINSNFPAGGVTVNVAAGYAETSAAALPLLTAQGTGGATGQIIFQKAGTGANPKITAATGASTTVDGIVRLNGADYVTFDGIDLSESAANTTAATQMEFGYVLFRPTTTNGCQNNTIKNCVVTLNKTNVNTIGIYGAGGVSTSTLAVAATSPAGANSGNKIFGCVITNAVQGIYLTGSSSTLAANFDLNNEIGVSGANTVGNFGGTASGWGIGVNVQNGAKIANNVINSTLNYTSASASTAVLASTVTSTLRGIYGNTTGTSSNIDITNNTITLASGATSSSLVGIDNGIGSTAAGNTVNITGNTVQMTYATATTATIAGIINSASAATVNLTGNTVQNTTAAATTGSFNGITNTASATTVNVNNNIVTNNTLSGTGAMVLLSGGSPTTLNLNLNALTGNSKTGTVASGILYCIQAGTAVVTANANTISNNSITATGISSGTLFGYYNVGSPTVENLTNNVITNLTIGGASTSTSHVINGMRFFTISTDVMTIAQNTIGTLAIGGSGSGIVTGMQFSSGGGTGSSISRNKIYDLSAAGTAGFANGIAISGGTTFPLSNNLIGDLRTPASTNLLAIAGLSMSSGTQVNAYYNTIYLNASSSGATFGTSGILFGSTSPILDLRNNIIVNTSTAAGAGGLTAALRRSSGTAATVPANYATTSNNNLFWAGTPSATNLIYVEGTTTATNAQQTLAAHKAFMGNRDQSSVSENPSFLSTTGNAATFLHINPAVATQVESGGAAITGITTDFDGDTRNATPDIGADEGTFTPSDLTPPNITYTTLGNTASTTNRTIAATITDFSGVATGAGAPRIYYRKGTSGVYFSALATSVASGVYTFTLDYANAGGAPVAGDVFQYYVAAQDASINNNSGTSPSGGSGINPPGGTAPATPNQYTVLAALSGNYYVGTSAHTPPATYATLTAAAAAYNGSGLAGAVNFILIDPTYSTAETFPITFNANGDASVANRLTISPEAGVNATVSGTNTTALLLLNGADYVTLDGSNNATTTRNLTLANAGGTTVLLSGASAGGGATNDVLRNLNITASASTSGIGVSVGGATAGTTGADNDNVTIQNNSIQQAFVGIYVGGTAAVSAGGADGLSIVGNVVGPVASGTGNIGSVGLFVANAVAPSVTGNTVQNVGIATAGSLTVGMNFSTGVPNATVTGNTISGVTVTAGSYDALGLNLGTGFTGGIVDRNQVLNIVSNTSTYGGRGIDISTGSAASNLRVSNNFVAGINGSGWSGLTSDAIAGIRILGTTGGVGLYYNSVNLSGSYSTVSASVYQSAALYVASTATALDVRNNVFANTLVNGTSTSKAYAFYSSAPKTAFTAINYNDYFVGTGTQALLGNLGGTGATVGATGDLTTLAAFQAATGTGQDANSLSVDPVFTSTTDLHTSVTALNAAATPIAGITTDLDGDVRNASTPDVGADEFTPATLDLRPTALTAPATGQSCYSNAEPVTVTVQNNATAQIDFAVNTATVTVSVTGAATQSFTTTLTSGVLAAGATQNVTLPGTLNMTALGTYSFAVTATVTGDANTANDNLATQTRTVVAPALTSISASPTLVCGTSGTVTLTATGAVGGTVTWYSAADGYTTALGTGNPLVLTGVSASTSYRANVVCGASTSANSNVVAVTVANPSVTGTNSPVARCGSGPVTLTATPSAGTTTSWYDTNASTTVLATGSAYTPTVTATRQFFAAAGVSSGVEVLGRPAPASVSSTTASSFGLVFNAASAFVLSSVDVYPAAAAGTVTIQVQDNTGTPISGLTGTYSFPAGTGTTPFTISLGYAVPAGTGLRLIATTSSAALVRESSIGGFPYNSPSGNVSITSGYISGTTTTYYYFYNWQLGQQCQSARTAVQVNVTPPPALTYTGSTTVCSGSSTVLTFSPNSYTTLSVLPTTGTVVNSAAGTITFNPTATTAYTITGNDGTGPAGCSTTTTATITVNPVPNAPTLTPGTPAAYCAGGSTVVAASSNILTLTNQPILATADFNTGANGFTTTPAANTDVSAGFARKAAPFSVGGIPVSTNGPDNNGSGSFYVADSDVFNSVISSTLVSPAFSTVGYTSANLNFQQYFRYNSGETAVVEYSLNGTAWANLATYTSTQGTASGVQPVTTLALPAAAIGQATVQIRFRYVANDNWYWTIDNIGVTGNKAPEAPVFAVSPAVGASVSGSNITFSPGTTSSYTVTASYPSSGCPSVATPITITVTPAATATAGTAPATVCAGYTYATTGSFGGSATSATYTSSGTGTFSNGGVINATTTSVSYTPSAADIAAGSVTLTLTTAGPCAAVAATLALTINTSTTWTGIANTEWNNPANWSSGCVPNLQLDALVPSGTANSPSDLTYVTNSTSPTNPLALARNLTIAAGAFTELYAHDLNLSGNLTNNGNMFQTYEDGLVTGRALRFVGAVAQTAAGMPKVYDLEVANTGPATVAVTSIQGGGSSFDVLNSLTMTSGLLNLGTATAVLSTAGSFPAFIAETETSYVLGQVRTARTLSSAGAEDFGGLGLVLNPAAGSTVFPGATTVTRSTGAFVTGVSTSQSVLRQYRVQPTVDAGLDLSLSLAYFTHELNGAAANAVTLFSAAIPAGGGASSGPWQPYPASANATLPNGTNPGTVTLASISHLSDWTLGRRDNPLPVTLTRFEAVRRAATAELSWATATEKNNAGFEVQLSTDGRTFRTLHFVEPASANSSTPRRYGYTDREAGKTGLRYYRLRLLDLDGTATFSAVRALSFDGLVGGSLTAAPNPFADGLTLGLQTAKGLTAAPLTLTDATGRTLRTERLTLPAGPNQVLLSGLGELPAGVYFLHLPLDGKVQHLKVVKE